MRTLFVLLFAGSGAAAIAYEIVWMRLLSYQLGQTVVAVGTVLAAFMGGLAAGALLAGRLAPRVTAARALTLYAALEGGLALWAVVFPMALEAVVPIMARAYGDAPGPGFLIVRTALSGLLVFAPACAMGATFPLAVRWFVPAAAAATRDAGGLYAVNAAGGVVAALLAGFVLIPVLGLWGTTAVAMACNGAAAVGGWLIAVRSPEAAGVPTRAGRLDPRSPRRRPRPAETAPRPVTPWLAGGVLAVSGFAALAYEVSFTRVLVLALGPTTYAFAAVLAAFVGGIAVGSAVTSRLTSRTPMWWLGVLLLAGAAAASTAAWFAGTRLPSLMAEIVADESSGPWRILGLQAGFAVIVLLPLACCLGALFPLATAASTRRDGQVAHEVSILYGLNTVGAIAGSLVGALLLVPAVGVQASIRIVGLVAVAGAVLAILADTGPAWRRRAGAALAAATAMLVVLVPAWDRDLLSSGGYRHATQGPSRDRRPGLTAGQLLYYRDGAAATVSVRRVADTTALAIDGKVDASDTDDMLTQQLLGHLPLLLHPDPRQVAIVGLGSGVTLGAALSHGVVGADVIEISPDVVDVAARFFADANRRALDDPRTRLIVGDGRSHLRLTAREYDVIVSEPSNPWMAGVASLFTREFFLAARDRLRPGGIFCQWAHTYEIAPADLQSIAATFASVFPDGTMWLVAENDLLLVASTDAPGPRLGNIAAGWRRPGVAEDLARVSVFDPFSLLSLYVGGPAELHAYGAHGTIQTDDRPRLEFSAPGGLYADARQENVRRLSTLLDPAAEPDVVRRAVAVAGAPEWRHRGQMLLRAQAPAAAFTAFARSLQLDPDDDDALNGLIDAAGRARRVPEARRLLESLAGRSAEPAAQRIALARLLAATGAFDDAVAQAEAAGAAGDDDPRRLEVLASILSDAGDVAQLRPLANRLRQRHPDRAETWYYTAMVAFLDGDLRAARDDARRIVQIDPRHAPAHHLIGAASASLGDRDEARRAFRRSLELSPRDASTYANLGLVEMESGRLDAAAALLNDALALDPDHAAARRYLPAVLQALDRR